ncbi:hypothetical protein SEA_ARCADIA_40 [Arthrobacter phage Arcadia]|uniref:Uncharacterized protein n=1 Tax=Arthrobacter phage Arcadia TaxID=2024274 RepID=A0A222Z6B9_9CAUD|nr:hypothetical protein PQB74_gp40 [Arthrobacter phage Arcadia]ASR80061.1 hypothetical protein SEA_ARCADIA_40 [Arthrobacter phage Arcadia]ASR80253.1 hypothetical protein SEA_ELSA_40 [Arthrobacter phage Elsa]ASR80451.1 hypothetical protein SEA_NASON_40 [Arthrobacter phage Nason]
MSMIQALIRELKKGSKPPPEMHHLWCCNENLSLCGEDITNLPINDGEGDQLCVICHADAITCLVCGMEY